MRFRHVTIPLLSTAGDATLTANSTGDKGHWGTGPNSYVVRRVAVQKTATDAWAAAASFSFREASGTAASATGNEFARVTFATTALVKAGIRFNDSFTPRKIRPGSRVVVNVRVAATGELFRAWALIEPSPERLQNFGTGKYISVTN
jgi:hypothetical protein